MATRCLAHLKLVLCLMKKGYGLVVSILKKVPNGTKGYEVEGKVLCSVCLLMLRKAHKIQKVDEASLEKSSFSQV